MAHPSITYLSKDPLLVHASVAGEGLPTVMIEAMIYGLPMVVTDSKVGPREILKDSEYGLLSKVRDPEDMARKVNDLLSNQELYTYYKCKEKERLGDFTPTVIGEQIDKVLYNLN